MWSRIVEEGVPVQHASVIVGLVDFDMSGIEEDDDYIGDVALAYAEYCAKVYRKLELSGMQRTITSESLFMRKIFNPLGKVSL